MDFSNLGNHRSDLKRSKENQLLLFLDVYKCVVGGHRFLQRDLCTVGIIHRLFYFMFLRNLEMAEGNKTGNKHYQFRRIVMSTDIQSPEELKKQSIKRTVELQELFADVAKGNRRVFIKNKPIEVINRRRKQSKLAYKEGTKQLSTRQGRCFIRHKQKKPHR